MKESRIFKRQYLVGCQMKKLWFSAALLMDWQFFVVQEARSSGLLNIVICDLIFWQKL
jgi:hypothetical protein